MSQNKYGSTDYLLKKNIFIIKKLDLIDSDFTEMIKINTRYAELIETKSNEKIIQKTEQSISLFIDSWLEKFDLIGYHYYQNRGPFEVISKILTENGVYHIKKKEGIYFFINRQRIFNENVYNNLAGCYILFFVNKSLIRDELEYSAEHEKYLKRLLHLTQIIMYEDDYLGGKFGLLFKDGHFVDLIDSKVDKYLKL